LLTLSKVLFSTISQRFADNSGRRPLSVETVVRINTAHACVPRLDEAECMRGLCYNLLYRTMDGTCNNLQRPLRGAAFRPYNRLAFTAINFSPLSSLD
jgi:hypothetical protein